MFKISFVVLLLAGQILSSVPSIINAQQWTSNFLNLFSDNFRNLLQQIPTSPLSTSPQNSFNNLLIHQPASLQSNLAYNSPLSASPAALSSNYAYDSRYSRSKEILQYSDEDSLNGLTPNTYLPQSNAYAAPVYPPLANDYYNYQFADNGLSAINNQANNQQAINSNYLPNQLSPTHKAQFDDDPLYDVLAKANLNKKDISPIDLNKNVRWDDYSNVGLNINAYNLDNIYNNRFDYNRIPVAPAHVSFVPPPSIPNLQTPNQHVSNKLYQPNAGKLVSDLQQSPGTSNIQVNNPPLNPPLNPPVNQPHSAYSSFLAANKLDLSNFNTPLPSPVNQVATNQVISTNSVEQQYEQAKPRFTGLLQSNENYPEDKPKLTNNNIPVNLAASQATATAYPDDALYKLYQTFASAAFNGNNKNNENTINQVKNPSVIYYDNVVHHQTPSQPVSSSIPATLASSTLSSSVNPAISSVNSVEKPSTLITNQLNSDQQVDQSSLLVQNQAITSAVNSLTSSGLVARSVTNDAVSTLTTNAVAPNLDSKVELTTQSTRSTKVTRKKPIKVKRKNQRKNQHDFGSRRKKDELQAIEK